MNLKPSFSISIGVLIGVALGATITVLLQRRHDTTGTKTLVMSNQFHQVLIRRIVDYSRAQNPLDRVQIGDEIVDNLSRESLKIPILMNRSGKPVPRWGDPMSIKPPQH